MARVLPVPAPASTHTGPRGASTTLRCSGSSPSSVPFVDRDPSMDEHPDRTRHRAVPRRADLWTTKRTRDRKLRDMAGKQDKGATKEAAATRRAERKAKRGQIFEAFKMQRRDDKLLVPLMAGSVVGVAALAFVVGLFFHLQFVVLPLGVLLGALLAVFVFGRRRQRSVYTKAEGQPGAAGWAAGN